MPHEPVRDPARIAHAYRRMLAVISDGARIDRVASTAARLAAELLRADGSTVSRVRSGYIEYIAGTGVGTDLVGRTLPLDGSFTGRVARQGQPLIFDPRTASVSSLDRAREDQITSGVVCPVLIEGRVVGTIGAASRRVGAFDEECVERLRELAEFVSLGLERQLGRRRIEQAWHFFRQCQLAQRVVERIETPMTPMMDALTALFDTVRTELPDDEAAARHMRDALAHAESLSRLCDDLRSFADARAPGATRQPDPVDLTDVLRQVVEHMRPRIERVAELDLVVSDEPVFVLGARGQLWQIAHALLDNAVEAIEARPRGMHRVELRCTVHAFTVELVVEDTGEGIASEALALIFEPFYTTRGDDARGAGGLGLTLVWRAVTALGGTIDVSSQAGDGARFTVRVPRYVDASR